MTQDPEGLDPRRHSPEKLEAPLPLPHISRRALGQVKNPVPFPDECPYCDGTPRIVDHMDIYDGRRFGDWPYAVACDSCDAYVGLHPHTDIPLGTLANQELREARKRGKAAFEAVRKRRRWSRSQAYRWLAERLHIELGACHWGWFDLDQCARAYKACQRALDAQGRS